MDTDTTKGTQEDISTGDVASGEKPAESSSKPEMLTKEQAEKLANERHSKLDKRIAELEKTSTKASRALEAAEARATAAEEALANAEKAKEEAEFEGVRNNPDALSTLQAKKAVKDAQSQLARERAALAREKAEHADRLERAAKIELKETATEIASRYKGVEASELIDLTDGTPEKMEKMAVRLSGGKTTAEPPPKKEPFVPDSGDGKGTPGKPTNEQMEKWTDAQYMEWAKTQAR